jgi:hypothetical protein
MEQRLAALKSSNESLMQQMNDSGSSGSTKGFQRYIDKI